MRKGTNIKIHVFRKYATPMMIIYLTTGNHQNRDMQPMYGQGRARGGRGVSPGVGMSSLPPLPCTWEAPSCHSTVDPLTHLGERLMSWWGWISEA